MGVSGTNEPGPLTTKVAGSPCKLHPLLKSAIKEDHSIRFHADLETTERNNKDTGISDWLIYFDNTILDAQRNTIKRVDFYVAQAKFYEKFRGVFNERQDRVIARMFREGIDGFKGGLSAENYISITKTSRATATRDLQELVEKSALNKTGELRHTRYHLNLPSKS